jgi:hypothetical protein
MALSFRVKQPTTKHNRLGSNKFYESRLKIYCFKKQERKICIGLIWINIQENGWLLCEWDSIFGFYKIPGISWLAQCKLFIQERNLTPLLPENDLILQMRQSLEQRKYGRQVGLVQY